METQRAELKTQKILADATGGARGFTLIEVMIVVGIIVILAGIGIAVGMSVKRGAAERQTRTTLDGLDQAMTMFLKDHPEQGLGGTGYVTAFRGYPETAKVLTNLKCTAAGVPDGYGVPIQYKLSDPTKGAPGYFWSWGPDGKPGTPDDIYSHGTSAQ